MTLLMLHIQMIFCCFLVFQGTEDYKQPVDNDVMQWMKENKSEPLPKNGCDDDYAELFLEVMLINGSQFPKDASSALALYQSLLQTIDNAVG